MKERKELSPENYESVIKKRIIDFVNNSNDNRLHHINKEEKFFEKPLIGFASGNDPLFLKYKNKNIIGDFYLTPEEMFTISTGDNTSDLTVICWILPISEETKRSNSLQKKVPSMRWAHTRNCGEKFNNKLREYVVSLLVDLGFQAVAPMHSPHFEWKEKTDVGLASTWSERHAMFAAGLGTFGLCDGFITPVGKAMRCGSVITNLKLQPSERSYENHLENCLFFNGGTCQECIKRCPGDAITEDGHNKEKCLAYQRENINKVKYNVEIAGCGLCQTGVPCESKIPGRED